MKVFVTGATGLIGGAAVRALVKAGHEVTGLTSRQVNVGRVESLGARALVGDMRDASAYGEVVRAADAVIHAAATFPDKLRYSRADVDGFMDADAQAVDGLVSVLGPQCKALVVTSGAYVYGDTGPMPVDETFSTERFHAVMKKKVDLEKRLLGLAASRKVPAILIRPGFVYGDGSLWGKFFLDAMKKGRRAMMPGDGSNVVSFVHVDDVGAGYATVVANPRPGEIYNVADDEPAPLGEVLRAQAAALGAPPPRSIPAWLVRIIAGKFGGPPTLAHSALSSAKLKALGWKPKYPSYRGGVQALARSLRPVGADRRAP